ncbi:type II toxin-antitoxin system antitoxin TsaA, partial [Staphylococcus warneri]
TYNANLDDTLWLVPGLIVCGLIMMISFAIAITKKDLLSEVLFFINIILTLYYIYPIFYDFL